MKRTRGDAIGDYVGGIKDTSHEPNVAALVLSKYERVQILAARVEQLLAGAPPLIGEDVANSAGGDVQKIAELEIARRVLPMRIARAMPNGKVRVHDLRDFIDPLSAPDLASVAM